MDNTKKPMETIDAWQKWYKENKIVAEMNEPLATKDSRENMHNTTNVIDSLKDASAKTTWMEKAKDHFADTLAEYQYELSGKDFYKAFYQAAVEAMECAHKEYEQTKELVDMLRYHHLG
jgi:hypothetical protein